jgi:hypothetical protein
LGGEKHPRSSRVKSQAFTPSAVRFIQSCPFRTERVLQKVLGLIKIVLLHGKTGLLHLSQNFDQRHAFAGGDIQSFLETSKVFVQVG